MGNTNSRKPNKTKKPKLIKKHSFVVVCDDKQKKEIMKKYIHKDITLQDDECICDVVKEVKKIYDEHIENIYLCSNCSCAELMKNCFKGAKADITATPII